MPDHDLIESAQEARQVETPPPIGFQGDTRSQSCEDETTLIEPNVTIKTSPRRWLILLAMSTYTILSGVTDTTSPILDVIVKLLDLDLPQLVRIQFLTGLAPLVVVIPAAWFVETYGIRIGMYGSTLFLIIRNVSRALMFNPELPRWQELKLIYYITSCLTGFTSIAIFYCLPLRVSEAWFSESERSIAWTIIVSGSGIGSSIAAALLPRYITSVGKVVPLFYLNIGCTIVTTVVVLLGINKSAPKYPPSKRVSRISGQVVPVRRHVKRLLTYKNLALQLTQGAIFQGISIAIASLIQDILTSVGHSKVFVGDLISINDIISLVSVVALSSFVHRVTDPTFVCKLASLFSTALFVLYVASMAKPMSDWLVMGVTIAYNIGKSWAMPNHNNMVAHLTSGQVSQPVVSGYTIILITILVPVSSLTLVSLKSDQDYSLAIIVAAVICLINSAVYIIFFDGQRKEFNDENTETSGQASA